MKGQIIKTSENVEYDDWCVMANNRT